MDNSLVSIVIPVHNKPKAEKCLGYIRNQSYKNIETILVDTKGFPAEKRNYGYSKSHGDYVLFLDEDEYLSRFAIENSVKEFMRGFDIVVLKVIKPSPNGYMEKCISTVRILDEKPLFFRRDVLEKIGPFHIEYVLDDDREIRIRALASGFRESFLPSRKGYIFHDETNKVFTVFRKVLLGRNARRLQQKQYPTTLADLNKKIRSNRSRILQAIKKSPSLIFGIAFVVCFCYVIRRIP